MSQTHDLYRALLRPSIIHTLRAAGFHSTKPSVLDTLTNIAERYLLLLASTTAQHAYTTHNEIVPTVTDVRMAMAECGILLPVEGAAEEEWREIMRRPVQDMGEGVRRDREGVRKGGEARMRAEKRKREEEDVKDVAEFKRWFDSQQHAEMRRIAGMTPDAAAAGVMPTVGVGGGVVQAEDFLTVLKKRYGKAGDDSRLQGTVLGRQPAEEKEVLVEGGPVQRIRDWRPRLENQSPIAQAESTESREVVNEPSDSGTEPGDAIMAEREAEAAAT